MKKISLLFLAVALLAVVGCSSKGAASGWWDGLEGDRDALEKAAYTGEVNTLEGVSMTLVRADSRGGTFTALNTTDKDIEYGAEFRLQRLVDGCWIPAPNTATWTAQSFVLRKDKEAEIELDWSVVHDAPLPSGTYRVVKGFMEYRGPGDYTDYDLAAEFEVK